MDESCRRSHRFHKGTGSDGLETDDAGNLYMTAYEHNAVLRRRPDGSYETLVHDPRLLWPDTMSVAADGYLYVTTGDGGCDYRGDSGCGGANDAARDRNVLLGKVLRENL